MSYKDNGKRFNDDFRKMVVELYHSGQSVRDLSSEYVEMLSAFHAKYIKYYP